MRIRETTLVAARELHDAMRSRWFIVAAGCFLALSLGLAMLGLAGAQRSGLAGFDRTTASLLNLALVFVPLVTLSLGGLGIAGELEDGSLALLLAQPITRGEAYAGKYLGLLAAVTASICIGFGATGIIVGVAAGSGNARGFLALVALTLLLGAATLSIGTVLSVALRARARVIGAAFAVWLLLVYVSDLGTIGLTLARNLAPGQVFTLALLNPVQQARVLGTLALTDRLDVLGTVGAFGLDHFGTVGLPVLLAGVLLAATALPFVVGYVLFRRTAIT
ncbi:MAG TPA: ABC transporter permease subunit [Candidatus Margulisiibacteriota bacterium]|nr:ABC transporter permease subunit [Candidatus Margulisiibacteriota bacterium]